MSNFADSPKKREIPIHLITGIGNNMVQGLGLLCESPDGSPWLINVWAESDNFQLIKFIDPDDGVVDHIVQILERFENFRLPFTKSTYTERWVTTSIVITRTT